MWMVDPKIMCRKHLLGEHVEHHMFIGSLRKKLSMDGYVANNLMEPLSLSKRHAELVVEMLVRGFKHHSPLKWSHHELHYLPDSIILAKVDKEAALEDLLGRCPECRARWEEHYGSD
jgi:hypothetical protein